MQENTVHSEFLETNMCNICNVLSSNLKNREWESKCEKMLNIGKSE